MDKIRKILDFTATWCGPCKRFKPILEKFSTDSGIEIEYIDIDENPDMAVKYNIKAVPTVVYLENEQIVTTLTGLQSELMLRRKLLGE